jgi:hypothetical protein
MKKPKPVKPQPQMSVDAINAQRKTTAMQDGVAALKDQAAKKVPEGAVAAENRRWADYAWKKTQGYTVYEDGSWLKPGEKPPVSPKPKRKFR